MAYMICRFSIRAQQIDAGKQSSQPAASMAFLKDSWTTTTGGGGGGKIESSESD